MELPVLSGLVKLGEGRQKQGSFSDYLSACNLTQVLVSVLNYDYCK